MTSLRNFIATISAKVKAAFGKNKNRKTADNYPEFIETVNRIKNASAYNSDLARLLNNYKENKTDFRITLKRGKELKSLKDLNEIKEKYDLTSVE